MNKKAILFCNGNVQNSKFLSQIINPNDYIIAVDGGYAHCRKINIAANILIGDLDSIKDSDLKHADETRVKIKKYSKNKDKTDLELALEQVVELNIGNCVIVGGYGDRWDHSLMNIFLAASQKFKNISIEFHDEFQKAFIVRGRKIIESKKKSFVSLIPLSKEVLIEKTSNLKYSLKNEILYFGSSRSISNVLIKEKGGVVVKKGVLLCLVFDREY